MPHRVRLLMRAANWSIFRVSLDRLDVPPAAQSHDVGVVHPGLDAPALHSEEAPVYGPCRLSEACVASDLRRQFAKGARDRGSDASGEVSIARFRGVLESGLGVVDLADNLVLFGREFDANHKMGVSGAGPGQPEHRDRVIVLTEIQASGRQAPLHGLTETFQRVGFQVVKVHVSGHGDVARRE
jgi:hypothetical protein